MPTTTPARRVLGCTLVVVALLSGTSACGYINAPAATTSAIASTRVEAETVMAAFAHDGLPVHKISDITSSCKGALAGCVELVISDGVSVYRFSSDADAAAFDTVGGNRSTRFGALVVSFGDDTLSSYTRQRFLTVARATTAGQPVPAAVPEQATPAEKAAAKKKAADRKKATRVPDERRCQRAYEVVDQTRTDLKAFQGSPMTHLATFPKQLARQVDTFDDNIIPGSRRDVGEALDDIRSDLTDLRDAVRSVNQPNLRAAANQLNTHAHTLRSACDASSAAAKA